MDSASIGKKSEAKAKCIELLRNGYVKGFEEMFLLAHEKNSTDLKYREKPVLPDDPQERQRKLDQLDEDGITKRRLYSITELSNIQKLWNGIQDAEYKKGK